MDKSCDKCEFWSWETEKGKRGGSCNYSGLGNCKYDEEEDE